MTNHRYLLQQYTSRCFSVVDSDLESNESDGNIPNFRNNSKVNSCKHQNALGMQIQNAVEVCHERYGSWR